MVSWIEYSISNLFSRSFGFKSFSSKQNHACGSWFGFLKVREVRGSVFSGLFQVYSGPWCQANFLESHFLESHFLESHFLEPHLDLTSSKPRWVGSISSGCFLPFQNAFALMMIIKLKGVIYYPENALQSTRNTVFADKHMKEIQMWTLLLLEQVNFVQCNINPIYYIMYCVQC